MRVAVFSEVYWPMVSGVAVTLGRLADALGARNHAVRVYSATYPLPAGVADRPEVHRSASTPLFLSPNVQWAWPRFRPIADDLAAFRPDIVHLATEFAMGFIGLRAARALQCPVIASAHTDYEAYAADYGLAWVVPPGWHYLRWFYGHAARVLAPTSVYESHLHARGVMHTGIWGRGVDTDHFHPGRRDAAYRARFGLGPDDVLVTYVGRIAPEKRLRLLLDAWEALEDRRQKAALVLVGAGPMDDEIRARAIPGVHQVGMLHGQALATAYASADLFAFPSPTETFGNVVLEAMASGLAPITAAAGGVLELVQHGSTGWLVPPDDRAALSDALARLIADRDTRTALGVAARHAAMLRRWDAVWDRLIDDYAGSITPHALPRAA